MGQLTRTRGWYLSGFDMRNALWDWLESSKKEEVEMGQIDDVVKEFRSLLVNVRGHEKQIGKLEKQVERLMKRVYDLEHPTVPELPTGCTFAEAMEGVARGEEWRREGWTTSSVGRCLLNHMIVWQSRSRTTYSPTVTDIQATDWVRAK